MRAMRKKIKLSVGEKQELRKVEQQKRDSY